MPINWLSIPLAALIPLVVGAIWYNPKVFGKAWMNASNMTEEKVKGTNMILVIGLSFLFSAMIAMILANLVIHQMGFISVLVDQPGFGKDGSKISLYVADFMKQYGSNFRTFKHGSFHGALTAVFFALPLIGTQALYERKGFKYIAIHVGYWMVSLALMGGLICAWMPA